MKRYHAEVKLDFIVECNEYELPEAIEEGARMKLEEGLDIWDDNVNIDELEVLE